MAARGATTDTAAGAPTSLRRTERRRGGAGRRRHTLPLIVWLVTLGVGTWLFHSLGSGELQAPPLDPRSWNAWADGKDALVATVAVLRLVVLALCWYLVGATTIGIVARLAQAARLVRVADALTVPALRRFLQAALGVSLATTMVAAAVPSGTGPVGGGRATMVSSAPASSTTMGPAMPDGALPPPPMTEAVTDAASRPGDAGVPPDSSRPLTLELAETGAAREPDEPAARAEPEEPASAERDEPDERAEPEEPASAARVEPDEPPAADESGSAVHTVVAGESLWTIAHDALAAHWGRGPTDAEVARYWHEVIVANRVRLADADNPDLIFPEQTFVLPPLPDAER